MPVEQAERMDNMIIRIPFFDGIYDLERVCIYLGHDTYRVFDVYPDGQEIPVHYLGREFVNADEAIILLEHTYNVDDEHIAAIKGVI